MSTSQEEKNHSGMLVIQKDKERGSEIDTYKQYPDLHSHDKNAFKGLKFQDYL